MNASRRWGWVVLALIVAAGSGSARAAGTATINVMLPTFIAKPGDTVKVFLDLNASPAAFGITSVEYRLKLGSSVVQSARVLNEGFAWTWGTPFVNAGPDSVLLAAAGASPVATSNPRMSTVELVIKPSATPGTDFPLTFTRLLLNEGTPSISYTTGTIKVRTGSTGVAPGGTSALSLRATPNPARGAVTLAWRVPPGSGARLELFTIEGRRVRSAVVATESGEVRWALRAGGERLAPGVYLARLQAAGGERVVRVAALE
jgi:hypothetical protein